MERTRRSPPAPRHIAFTGSVRGAAGDHRFDPHEANAVEPHQAGRGAQPEIAVGAVQDLVDGLAGEAILRGPDIVAVLVDVESGIQSQRAARRVQNQCEERARSQV